MLNTLGIFENQEVFAKQVGCLALIGGMYTNRTDWVGSSSSEESKEESKLEGLDAFIKEVSYSNSVAQFDYCGVN